MTATTSPWVTRALANDGPSRHGAQLRTLNPDGALGRRIVHVAADRARAQLVAECHRCGDVLTIADRNICRQCRLERQS